MSSTESSGGSFSQALKWAFVLSFGRRAFGTVFTIILAGLLGPHDFGLVAMALIYIALVQVVLEQGLSTAIVQRDDLEPEHVDSAFWLTLAWCAVLAGVSIAVSGWWADLNDQPRLELLVKVLSVLVVIEGLHIVQQAVLQRAMRFKELAIRSNVAAALGGCVGIVLAVAGTGVWALVAQQIVLEASSLVLVWVLSDWKPRLRFSFRHGRQLLSFSTGVLLANLGGFVNRRADALMMGIFFGPVAVGLYRLADRFVDVLLEMTNRPIGLVSLPVLSRVQTDREALRGGVEKCLRATLLLTVPAMLVLAACSMEVLRVIGSEWTPAAGALALLCLVGIAKAIAFFTGPVLFAISKAHSRAAMQWGLAAVSAGFVVGAGLLLSGASAGDQVLGMAASRVLLFVPILIPVNLLIISRVIGLRLRRLLPVVPAPLVSGGAAVAAVALLRWSGGLEHVAPAIGLLLAGALAVLVAGGMLALLDPRARDELSLIRRQLSRRGPPAPAALEPAPPAVE